MFTPEKVTGRSEKARFLSISLLLSSIILLSGCKPLEWMKGKSCGCSCGYQTEDMKFEGIEPEALNEVVVSFEGKPEVKGHDVERQLAMIIEAQPQIKSMLAYLPQEQHDQIINQLIDSMAMEKVMMRWLKETGKEKSAEFRKIASVAHQALDRDLAFKEFEKEVLDAIKLEVTEEVAKQYYAENIEKDAALARHPFVETMGGVKARGFAVDDEQKAKDLLGKVQKTTIDQAAKEAGKKVEDYGLVNQQSFMLDGALRNAILGTEKLPKTSMIKGDDGKFYIVRMSKRQEGKHAEFDKVKDAVVQVLVGKKFAESFNKKLEDLKTLYKTEINKAYVEKRKPKVEAEKVAEPALESATEATSVVEDAEKQADMPADKTEENK